MCNFYIRIITLSKKSSRCVFDLFFRFTYADFSFLISVSFLFEYERNEDSFIIKTIRKRNTRYNIDIVLTHPESRYA